MMTPQSTRRLLARGDSARLSCWTLEPDAELPSPAAVAYAGLLAELERRSVPNVDGGAAAPAVRVVIGIAGAGGEIDRALASRGLAVRAAAESLLIRRVRESSELSTLLIAGRDARGLGYALWELADAIAAAPVGTDLIDAVLDADESPFVATRGVSTHLFNADLEREWYFSEEYWRGYFSMLARSRFNQFILTFADQTNYMAPPFPWLFEVPGFEVSVEGLSATERATNLAMLRRIGELAVEHGLDFSVAIWQQAPVITPGRPEAPYAHNYGKSLVRNLPADAELARYCTLALARLLAEVPTVSGLQFRLNYECGIAEPFQPRFFQSVFQTVRDAGRPIRLDLRYKGLARETIDQALDAGLDVTVSTKFWCEHMGLPFHPTRQDPLYSASRYGYGTMLRRPRRFRVAYQLWNQGTSRLLLWGDPGYASRFARSCVEGEADAFEVFSPLMNKGWGNEPGDWRVFARRELEPERWEVMRHWSFFGAFGRQGFNPSTPASVWERGFVARFGAAGADMARALRAASAVLPFITAVFLPSASEWGYWPEIETGGPLESYASTPPSDYGQFYGVRAFSPPAGWHSGEWSRDIRGFVEDAVAGQVEAKWSPEQVSRELERLADEAEGAAASARRNFSAGVGGAAGAEFRAAEVDVLALASLARYHAAKRRAATELAFFRVTGEAARLPEVVRHATLAAEHWNAIASTTSGFYTDNLVFGRAGWEVGEPGKRVNAHAGHWKDRVADVESDVAFAQRLMKETPPGVGKITRRPGEEPPARLPMIRHDPVTHARAGQSVVIEVAVTSELPLKNVWLHHREMDQTRAWSRALMTPLGSGVYRGIIPMESVTGEASLLYYIEANVEGGGTLWPDWRRDTPYVAVRIER